MNGFFMSSSCKPKDFPIFDKIEDKKNVILIGDKIEDIDMIQGFDYSNIIKIGFLNNKVEEKLTAYKDNFDVVLINDTDMDYASRLVKRIVK